MMTCQYIATIFTPVNVSLQHLQNTMQENNLHHQIGWDGTNKVKSSFY